MKRYGMGLLACLVSGSVQIGYSQTIAWGAAQERSSMFNEQRIVRASEKELSVLHYYKDADYYFRYQILQYDADLQQRASTAPLNFLYQGQRGDYQASAYVGNQWRFYYTIPQAEIGQELLCEATFSQQTLRLEAPQVLLHTALSRKAMDNINYRVGESVSPTHTSTLLYGLSTPVRKQPSRLVLCLLDGRGSFVSKHDISIPSEAGFLSIDDIQDALVKDDGASYFLCKFYKKKSRKEEKKVGLPYTYALLIVDKTGQPTWSYNFLSKLKDSCEVVSARLYQGCEKQQHTIFCIGTYTTPSKAGFFKQEVPSVDATKVLDYPAALWRQQEQLDKSSKIGLKNYKIKKWLPLRDGNSLVIAEQQYTKVYWDKSEGEQRLHKLHDLLVLKWNADGQLLWYYTLPKRQRGGGEGYTDMKETWYSLAAFESNQQLHLFYNELPSNKNTSEALEVGYYNQPNALDFWHHRLDIRTGKLVSAKPVVAAKDWLVYPQQMRLLPNGQFLIAALKAPVLPKEKALLRWGHLSLDASE